MDHDIIHTKSAYSVLEGIPHILGLVYALSLSQKRERVPLNIICDHIKDVDSVSKLLHAFLPSASVLSFSANSPDVWKALHLADGEILVTQSAIATEKSTPTAAQAYKEIFEIRTYTSLEPEKIRDWCAAHGYERDTTANAPWTYAMRGNVVDIYIDSAIRIVCEDGVVQEIYTFDLNTGARISSLQSYTLLPEKFTATHTLLEVLPKNTHVLTWNISDIKTTLTHIAVQSLVETEKERTIERLPSYQHRLPELLKRVESADKILIVSKHADRHIGILHSKKALIINEETALEGCIDTAHNTFILTDHTIGALQNEAPKKRKKRASIMSLRPGDYAVHMFHGIAQFTGITQMKVNEIMHEYFVLNYAKGDKIYVPVELADYIDTYVGDPHPKLSRLSDASWNEVVARVKSQALDMARDLLHTYARRSIAQAPILASIEEEKQLQALCEFVLTKDQETALADIFSDCEKSLPMDRLLCGDVGFGKTELALRLAFRAVFNHQQVAILAPTTVLAQQHLDTFSERLNTFGIQVEGLSRFQNKEKQKKNISGIADGSIDIVIGTHRLLSRDVHWKSLGVIIVDEEQRFGVKAKEGLQHHRSHAHVLTMTATPIPRTLNLSLSGIRDISTILTAPLERKSIMMTIARHNTELIKQHVEREIDRHGQIYYIYNRVQGIELKKQEIQSLFPHMRIGIAHGQMEERELSQVMHDFDTGSIDMLLATTIVENGLDIPRANTIIVEQASQFGLADLYQLKGRVGRSRIQGHALFLYNEQKLDNDAHKRLTALQETDMLGAGFELALRDMEIRGVGNILGKDQHGHAVKIGLNLYGRLLHQAIQELEGNPEPPERDIPIDLPLEARIPETLFTTMEERILLYQELANITDIEELHARKNNFAHLPKEFIGLFDVLEIKILARRSSLLSISTTHPSSHNQLKSARITLSAQKTFSQLPNHWEYVHTKDVGVYRARTTIQDLGNDWVEKLKTFIRELCT